MLRPIFLLRSLMCLAGLTGAHLAQAQITTLAAFQDCIGPNGAASYGSTCHLSNLNSPYVLPFIDSTNVQRDHLTIGRSGVTITGDMIGGPSDTVLRRGSSADAIMSVDSSSVTNVTISYLTFDGNRYGAGLACLPGNAQFHDLELTAGGTFTVQWDDFINAPGTALFIGGGSTVSYSNFGQGGFGIGPNGVPGNESAPQTATRSTAIFIDGANNGAWYNAIAFAGTAAINLDGFNQRAYGNLLQQNRYELSDGSGGGQIFVGPNTKYAQVVGNVINGNFWPPSSAYTLATGCSHPTGQFNMGVEGYGSYNSYYNNEIEQHTSAGMKFGGSDPTGGVLISSANPYSANDTPRYIENNQGDGIVFLGPHISPNFPLVTQGVQLDDILVRNNSGFGVILDSIPNATDSVTGTNYFGFTNGSCMSNNHRNNISALSTTLSFPSPTSFSTYRGGACPNPGAASQTPAASGQPGWPW